MSALLIDTLYTPDDVYEYTSNGDVDELRLALAYGNNSTEWYMDENGQVALHIAARRGHIECVRELLDRGAVIESKDDIGITALIFAAYHGHIECMRELLDRGAAIESKDNDGDTALMFAAGEGHIECMRELLDRGADIESKSNLGDTALMIAARQGHIECMRELLDRGADIENKTNNGFTALIIAARLGHIECMCELLDRGADIEIESNLGDTALMKAAKGHLNCTRLLLDRGASIDEDKIKDSEDLDQECRQMILDEVQHRFRRAAFDSFIKHHIEHQPHINNIYSTCYPSGDLRIALPTVGWTRAEAVRDKYYFDEILFYVHLYVANVLSKQSQSTRQTRSSSRRCGNSRGMLANNSDTTSTLMTVLADRLKMYLQPE